MIAFKINTIYASISSKITRCQVCLLALLLFIGCNSGNPYQIETIPDEYKQTVQKRLSPQFNQEYVFFADLRKPSNEYRFFVFNMTENKIINRGLCCNGKENANGEIIFSNAPGSNCSSKGAYKVGTPYFGKFGKAFKLYGLDSSNSNAFVRNVVLHSYKYMPRNPVLIKIFNSEGCPTVSPDFLHELDGYITKSTKPILLYIKG